jgi:hypothetical protein
MTRTTAEIARTTGTICGTLLLFILIIGYLNWEGIHGSPPVVEEASPPDKVVLVWTADTTNEVEHLFLSLPCRTEPPTLEYERAFGARARTLHSLRSALEQNPLAIPVSDRLRLAAALRTSKPNWPEIFHDVVDDDAAFLEQKEK